MPKLRKCCVVGCNANNETHRLFNFPKDDKLRELWLSYMVPVNDKLSGLTKEQLLNRYVCQKHFDRYQFDSMGNRLAHGYPCLFTAKEMLHGIPLRSDNESHEYHLGDHNYSLLPTVEGTTGSTTTTIINAEGDKNDYSYAVNQDMEASTSSKIAETTATGEIVSETMATTGEAVEFIDKLFDSVNGSRGSTVKGKLRGPIKLNSKHFGFWQEAKEILKNITFIDKNSKKARKNNKTYKIRVPSLDGWMTTIESFVRLSKLLFEKYEIEYFYPRSVNQDPLENFFGRVRAINYRNVNPDANTFINSFKSLLMSNVMGPHSIYGNCEKDEGDTVVDFLELLSSPRNHEATDENKENVVPITLAQRSCNINQSLNAANERVRVHSSAYTAGYICRRLTKKFNCKNCSDTYAEKQKDSIHQWINQREYSLLKHSNLSYPSKRFLMLYRDISGLIHNHLNKYAHEKCLKKHLKNEMYKVVDFNWFGCTEHAEILKEWAVNLILRIHVHHWCNIINKVLKGGIQVKLHNQLSLPQKLAYEKYKTHRLRK